MAVYSALSGGGGPSNSYFERVYVSPRSLAFGYVTEDKSLPFSVYNASRSSSASWTLYDDSALGGSGVSITNSPTLPLSIPALTGYTYSLTATTSGPPEVSASAEFQTTPPPVESMLPVTLKRAVILPFEPESPVAETMTWVTDVLPARDGSEQRRALRETPRLTFEMSIFVDDSSRRRLANILMGKQHSVLGLPAWWNIARLSADISVSDTTISVVQTSYRDFRVGSLAIVLVDDSDWEVLEIASISTNSITFTSGFTKAFSKNTAKVMPVYAGYLNSLIQRERYRVDLERWLLSFRVYDNSLNIESTTDWNTYDDGTNTRVLLDTPNLVDGPYTTDSLSRKIQIVDADGVGIQKQYSYEQISKPQSQWGHVTQDMRGLWSLRQLLYALRGRYKSFWLPTFAEDIVPRSPGITASGLFISINNVGYTKHIKSNSPRNNIRLTLNDGTKITRKVTSSTELSPLVEVLSVSSAWGVTASNDEIVRVEFIEQHRFNSDEILITHRTGTGTASVTVPTRAVIN
jgi:hypothetical protein